MATVGKMQTASGLRGPMTFASSRSDDQAKFNREVYEEDAVVTISAVAAEHWNDYPGTRNLIRKAAEALEVRFGIDVGLVSDAEALEQELLRLEKGGGLLRIFEDPGSRPFAAVD